MAPPFSWKNNGLHDLGLDHLHPRQPRDQNRGVLGQIGKAAVVAGDHGPEIEIAPGCIGRARHVHGIMPTRRQNSDIGPIQIAHPFHIGHHIGIARQIDHLAVTLDHIDCRRTGADRPFGQGKARGMAGIDHRHLCGAQGSGAALVETDGFHLMLLAEIGEQHVDPPSGTFSFAASGPASAA